MGRAGCADKHDHPAAYLGHVFFILVLQKRFWISTFFSRFPARCCFCSLPLLSSSYARLFPESLHHAKPSAPSQSSGTVPSFIQAGIPTYDLLLLCFLLDPLIVANTLFLLRVPLPWPDRSLRKAGDHWCCFLPCSLCSLSGLKGKGCLLPSRGLPPPVPINLRNLVSHNCPVLAETAKVSTYHFSQGPPCVVRASERKHCKDMMFCQKTFIFFSPSLQKGQLCWGVSKIGLKYAKPN